MPKADPALLQALRSRIRALERAAPGRRESGRRAVPLGVAAVDGALPWGGLLRGALHEVLGEDHAGGPAPAAAAGFSAALLARAAAGGGTVLWCHRGAPGGCPPGNDSGGRGLYGPGLAGFGLNAGRLIVVRARTDTDVLWTMEESLRSGAPAAVLGEAAGVPPIALRRLQLAAEAGGVMALLLRPGAASGAASPAATRWRVAAAPSLTPYLWPGPPRGVTGGCPPDNDSGGRPRGPRWTVELLRCRGGAPGAWLLEWRRHPGKETAGHGRHDDATGGLALAAEVRHRPARPAAGGGPATTGRLAV